mmetsp:Transcript_22190/g.49946  ORF Transcript_22190/g.49946 Transcript_22190/m.49946 type:complete len:470 (-) Transcript_22190:213-1622(-)
MKHPKKIDTVDDAAPSKHMAEATRQEDLPLRRSTGSIRGLSQKGGEHVHLIHQQAVLLPALPLRMPPRPHEKLAARFPSWLLRGLGATPSHDGGDQVVHFGSASLQAVLLDPQDVKLQLSRQEGLVTLEACGKPPDLRARPVAHTLPPLTTRLSRSQQLPGPVINSHLGRILENHLQLVGMLELFRHAVRRGGLVNPQNHRPNKGSPSLRLALVPLIQQLPLHDLLHLQMLARLISRRYHPEAVSVLHLAYIDGYLRGLSAGPVQGSVGSATGVVRVEHLLAVAANAGAVAGVAPPLLEDPDFLGRRVVSVFSGVLYQVGQRLIRVPQLQTGKGCLGHVPEHRDHHFGKGGVGDLFLLPDGPLLLGLLALLLGEDPGDGGEGVDLPFGDRETRDLRERLGYRVLLPLRITCVVPKISEVIVRDPLRIAPVRRSNHPVPHHHTVALNSLHSEEAATRTQHPLARVPDLPD